jgi:AMP nucleosidase
MSYLDLKTNQSIVVSVLPKGFHGIINRPAVFYDPDLALDHVCNIYKSHVARLKMIACSDTDFAHDITYPYVGIHVTSDKDGLLSGYYGTTISHPDVLYDYYKEQFRIILEEHKVPIWIGYSTYPMSLTFIDEELFNRMATSKKLCPSHLPCMKRIRKGLYGLDENSEIRPLSVFHGERTGYSLNRLHHYCGSDARFFQNTVVFANYQIYSDLFIKYAINEVDHGRADALLGPGIQYSIENGLTTNEKVFNPQMPAYHLIRAGRNGITLINVNVGPSNIKTITDHIAVLRSHRWIMLGHCAGLRNDNKIGDYIIGHNYVRCDYVLDAYVPKHVPITSSNYLSKLFLKITENKTGSHVNFGTIVTTCDRNWELNPSMVDEFSEAKAIGIDMESATVATNAFRFGVESIAFLCISDMPLHGAPKLRSMAKEFYQTKVEEHFKICIEVCEEAILTGTSVTCSPRDDSFQYSHYKSAITPFK